MKPPVRICLFGGLRVEFEGQSIDRFQTMRTAALLAYLALHLGRPHPREAIAELLWPDGDPTAIRNRLNQAISSLRRQLHSPDMDHGPVIVADYHTVRLDGSLVQTDVAEFESHLKRAGHVAGVDRLSELLEAERLYSGELLPGLYDDWVVLERLRLADLRAARLGELALLQTEIGDADGAIESCRRRVAADPLDAEAQAELIDRYVAIGRAASAKSQLEEAASAFAKIGVELPVRLRAIRVDVPPPSLELRAESRIPREQSAVEVRRAWPILFGRGSELAQALDILVEDRLLTICGLGGVGKSRLAQEIGRIREEMGREVALVPLSAVREATNVLAEVDRALGRPLAAKGEAVDLILDNAEHLDDLATTVGRLIEMHPDSRIVVTSRRPLGCCDERILSLLPLPYPDPSREISLNEASKIPSVELFVARARQARADFALTPRTYQDVVSLVARLEGLPLALELAASWARALTPAQMLDRISSRVDFLENRRRDIPVRHRSLRAAIESSLSLLSDEENEALSRLSTFRGRFDIEAALRLCPDVDLVTVLDTLIERSLVIAGEWEGSYRYSILGLVAETVRSLVSPSLAAECDLLKADWVRDRANRETGPLPEHIDLVSAIETYLEMGDRPGASEIVLGFDRYWEAAGRLQEGIDWLERTSLPAPCARSIWLRGRLHWLLGDYVAGGQMAEEALQVALHQRDGEVEILARNLIAAEAHRRGNYGRSVEMQKANLASAAAASNPSSVWASYLSLGNACVEQRDWEGAEAAYLHALRLARESGIADREVGALCNLGNLARVRGQLSASKEWLDQALTVAERSSVRWHSAMARIAAARLAHDDRRPEEGLALLRDALEFGGENHLVAWRITFVGALCLASLGRLEDSARAFGVVDAALEAAQLPWNTVEFDGVSDCRSRLEARLGESTAAGLYTLGRGMLPGQAARLLDPEGAKS